MAGFTDATQVKADGAGGFEANLDPLWTVGGKPNGGYLLAILARAAVDRPLADLLDLQELNRARCALQSMHHTEQGLEVLSRARRLRVFSDSLEGFSQRL